MHLSCTFASYSLISIASVMQLSLHDSLILHTIISWPGQYWSVPLRYGVRYTIVLWLLWSLWFCFIYFFGRKHKNGHLSWRCTKYCLCNCYGLFYCYCYFLQISKKTAISLRSNFPENFNKGRHSHDVNTSKKTRPK